MKVIEQFDSPIDAVFIDYIQMVKSGGKNNREAIDDYIKDLREYAIEKDFCAIIGSQINRGTHDGGKVKPPSIWELKGTGSLEEHVDMCILVHWEYFYDHTLDEGRYWINVAKNRDGRTGEFECSFIPKYYKITESVCANDYGERRDGAYYREH